MKNLLIVLFACMSLTACAANVDSIAPEETDVDVGNNGEYSATHQDEGPVGCDRVSFMQITIDNQAYWVQLPTLCDNSPYIFKGDPDPDFEHQYTDHEEFASREEIVNEFNDRVAPSSRLSFSAIQR